jgi:GT2 family glycosyltransferase
MIPVLGVPILSEPKLLLRMLLSIDVPVGRTIVVDNGEVLDGGPALPEYDHLNITVIRPGFNLGVAASWNTIIKAVPDAPWWAIVNFDLVFAPGDLARLAGHMEKEGGVALLGTFSAFGVDRGAIKRAGMFDENFHPAYYEDNDFDYRCRLAGVPMAGLPAGLSHDISSTLQSNPSFRDGNGRSFPKNADYFVRKWGGTPYHEVYATPFNAGGDIRSWQLDVDRLAAQRWT